MKKITFARHGETDSNAGQVFNAKHEPLNAKGEAQALALAQTLKDEPFEIILCSPLLRTRSTARPLIEERDVLVEFWEELVEVDWGEMQGQSYLPKEEAFAAIKKGIYAETLEDLEIRAKQFWARLNELSEANILVVSHGAILCVLFAVYKGLTADEFEDYRFNEWEVMGNCDTKEILLLK